jgi:hypothetical protein
MGRHDKEIIPIFAIFLLLAGVFWLLSDLKIIAVSVPVWPIIIIVIAVGMIANHYLRKE